MKFKHKYLYKRRKTTILCLFVFAGVVLGFVSSEDIVLSETQSGGAVQLEFGVLEGYLSFRVLINAEFTGTVFPQIIINAGLVYKPEASTLIKSRVSM